MGPIHKMQPICAKCGKNLALVGRVHNCIPVANTLANKEANMANATYRYRDPEKRRAYMRDLMRKRRGGKTE